MLGLMVKSLERKLFDEVHIGFAVDSTEGLFVPVIKNAETKSDQELRQKVDEYKKSVGDRSVSPKDLQGATITLSNFGMIAGTICDTYYCSTCSRYSRLWP